MYGKFKKRELSKEELLKFWDQVLRRADFKFAKGEKVSDIQKTEDDTFVVHTSKNQYRTRHVVLALGKGGSPRKLGVKGEGLPKVMYRLIEADHYVNKKILVIGGGDSAVEAAMGLAAQVGNTVTLSYRQATFSRLKDRNVRRLEECVRKGKLKVIYNSNPVEFTEDSAILEVSGATQKLANDFVWIFAGGDPPTAFLKKIGVGFNSKNLTLEGSTEAKAAETEFGVGGRLSRFCFLFGDSPPQLNCSGGTLMKRPLLSLLCIVISMAACHKQTSQNDLIRDGIRQHLVSLKTINLSAMDINVTNVAINGNTAQAQVEYLPKTGAPPGAGMRVSYSMEKRDGQWFVVKTLAAGGAIDHPDPGSNPHTQPQAKAPGALPNFREMIPANSLNSNSTLPPAILKFRRRNRRNNPKLEPEFEVQRCKGQSGYTLG